METEKHQFFYLYKNICHCLVFLRSERTDPHVNSRICSWVCNSHLYWILRNMKGTNSLLCNTLIHHSVVAKNEITMTFRSNLAVFIN